MATGTTTRCPKKRSFAMENGLQADQANTTNSPTTVRRTFHPSERMTPEIRQWNQAIHREERESGDYASPDAINYFQAMAAMMIQ